MRFARQLKGIQILTKKSKEVIPYALAVGQVVNCPDPSTREVKVLKMEKNEYLKMFFNKSYQILSVDEGAKSKLGDIVLIRKLLEPASQDKRFEVEKILFQIDNIVDPMTGRTNSYEPDILRAHLENIQNKQK